MKTMKTMKRMNQNLKKNQLKKKLLSLVLSTIILTSLTNTAALASTTSSTDVNGDLSISEGAKPYVTSAKDTELVQKKLELLDSSTKASSASMKASSASSSDIFYKYMNVTLFKQKNNYYCGPATVKQVLHFIKGTSLSQDAYANSDNLNTTTNGTDMTRIPKVLNKNQSRNLYVCSEFSNYSDWDQRVRYSMIHISPAVIDINSSNSSQWKYKTSGHFMCISGYDNSSGTTYVEVTDPHYTKAGIYKYKASVVYEVNRAHWRSAILYFKSIK